MKNKQNSGATQKKKKPEIIDWVEIVGNVEPVKLFNYQEKYFFKKRINNPE